MRVSRSMSGWFLVLLCGGCEEERRQTAPAFKPASNPTKEVGTIATSPASKPRPPARAFLDDKKEVSAGVEWNREVGSRNGGMISFSVESQGPFAVTIVTGESYKSLMAGNQRPLTQSDVLLTADSKGPTYERKVRLPAGASYFIVANRAGKTVEFRLQCFPGS
jgi:hypothetical protein